MIISFPQLYRQQYSVDKTLLLTTQAVSSMSDSSSECKDISFAWLVCTMTHQVYLLFTTKLKVQLQCIFSKAILCSSQWCMPSKMTFIAMITDVTSSCFLTLHQVFCRWTNTCKGKTWFITKAWFMFPGKTNKFAIIEKLFIKPHNCCKIPALDVFSCIQRQNQTFQRMPA